MKPLCQLGPRSSCGREVSAEGDAIPGASTLGGLPGLCRIGRPSRPSGWRTWAMAWTAWNVAYRCVTQTRLQRELSISSDYEVVTIGTV